jgi:hypothetical protein
VKQVSYSEEETYYVAGRDVEDARYRERTDDAACATPQAAWDVLSYWDQEEHASEFEVFKFVTTVQVTKVDPPYTSRS